MTDQQPTVIVTCPYVTVLLVQTMKEREKEITDDEAESEDETDKKDKEEVCECVVCHHSS